MDAALKTPEIVSMILCYALDLDRPRSFSTLVSCTTVNRLFSGEALRLLWKRLKDLAPIVNLLRTNSGVDIWHLHHYLGASDWQRIAHYCSLVRSIYSMDGLTDAIIASYSNHFPNSSLLPNLETIGRLNQGNLIRPYLSSKLKTLKLVVHQDMGVPLSCDVLGELEELEEVALALWAPQGGSRDLPMSLLRPVLQKKLKSLRLSAFDLSTTHIQLINSLSPIERLDLSTSYIAVDVRPEEVDGSSPFPHLTHLRVSSCLTTSQLLIGKLGLHPRHSLHIESHSYVETADIFSSIARLRTVELRELMIRCPWRPTWAVPVFILPANTINPIYRLASLETLVIDPGAPIDLQDEDIGSLTLTLPYLAVLHIGKVDPLSSFSTRLTPNCLKLIAQHSICLTSLHIQLGPQWASFIDDTEEFTPSYSLNFLNVAWSILPPEDGPAFSYFKVANKLHCIFPNLSSLDSDWKNLSIRIIPEGLRLKKAWERIDRVLFNL